MPKYDKTPELDPESIEDVEKNGFMPVNKYAVLWKPALTPDEEAYGRVYIYSERITKHMVRARPGVDKFVACEIPGCSELHGWTSFVVNSPQELATILDILRNGKDVSFRPTDYAIKTNWEEIRKIDESRVRVKIVEKHKIKI